VTGPERINPPALFQDVPYDYARVAPAGALVFTAGACPLDEAGRVVAPGNVEAQTRQTLDNLLAVLAEAGVGPESLLKTTVYVASEEQRDLVRAWEVVAKGLRDVRPPSTLLGVSMLGYKGQLVEIEAVALAGAVRT
jgi:enamine deaminase RidA (YjgF/YER057c/UK114 family)